MSAGAEVAPFDLPDDATLRVTGDTAWWHSADAVVSLAPDGTERGRWSVAVVEGKSRGKR